MIANSSWLISVQGIFQMAYFMNYVTGRFTYVNCHRNLIDALKKNKINKDNIRVKLAFPLDS